MSDLKKKVRAMLRDLRALGFGDDDASINGGDAVNTINGHFYDLEHEAGEDGDRPTNVDIITDLMEDPQQAPLIQMFVVEAIRKYAEAVAPLTPAELGAMPMIHPDAWIRTAKTIKARLEEAYK